MKFLKITPLILIYASPWIHAEECTALARKINELDYTRSSSIIARKSISFADIYNECDAKDNFLGKALPSFNGMRMKCSTDPNHVKRLVQFRDKTVVFEAKAAVDADGSYVSCSANRGRTDQCETWLTYDAGSPTKYVDAEHVPYVVIPVDSPASDQRDPSSSVSFIRATGIAKGDLAVAIYKGHCSFGIVGDAGPHYRLGEMSVASHADLKNPQCKGNEDPCTKLIEDGYGRGIVEGVTYIIFPGTRPKPLTSKNVLQVSSAGAKASLEKFIVANSKPRP
jgi:hypothetical protein